MFLRWLKRLTTAVVIVSLLASNALTLTSSSFNALISGAVAGATGIKTLSHINKETLERQRAAVKHGHQNESTCRPVGLTKHHGQYSHMDTDRRCIFGCCPYYLGAIGSL